MRDLYNELIDELDGIAEDLNPTDSRNIETIEPEQPEVVTKKTTRRK